MENNLNNEDFRENPLGYWEHPSPQKRETKNTHIKKSLPKCRNFGDRLHLGLNSDASPTQQSRNSNGIFGK